MSEHHSRLSALWKLREMAIARLDVLNERSEQIKEEIEALRGELDLINALIIDVERGTE